MMLDEANARLKRVKINADHLVSLNSLYLLLDIDKDEFCKIVDVLGVEMLIKKQSHYDRLVKAEEELYAKERYENAKRRFDDLENEKLRLKEIIDQYQSKRK